MMLLHTVIKVVKKHNRDIFQERSYLLNRNTNISSIIVIRLIFYYVFASSGGSLFLFDRKVLRYFRKDGHNWRKKKDGKTVKEAHERLKVNFSTLG